MWLRIVEYAYKEFVNTVQDVKIQQIKVFHQTLQYLISSSPSQKPSFRIQTNSVG